MINSLVNFARPRQRTQRGLVACVVGVLGASLLSSTSFAQMGGTGGSGRFGERDPGLPNATPEPLKGVELKDRLGSQIPLDLVFADSTGKSLRLGELFDRPVGNSATSPAAPKRPVAMLMMYYRCPMLCPMMLDSITRRMRELPFTVGNEYDTIIVSIDERDTPKDAAGMKDAALISYGRSVEHSKDTSPEARESISRGWTFLTAPAATSKTLADAMGFQYRFVETTGQFAHGAVLFVLTPDGRVSRYLTDMSGSSTDFRLALVDASSGAIGSWTDQLVLRCLHFNPDGAKYTMSVMRGMQIAAALGVGVLGLTIGSYLWAERRRRARVAKAAPSPVQFVNHGSISGSKALLSGHTG